MMLVKFHPVWPSDLQTSEIFHGKQYCLATMVFRCGNISAMKQPFRLEMSITNAFLTKRYLDQCVVKHN